MKKFNYPSPYVGKWKNLTGVLNGTPSALAPDERELMMRVSDAMNAPSVDEQLKDRDTALNRTRAIENKLTNAYLKDVVDGDEAQYNNVPRMIEYLKDVYPDNVKKDIILDSANSYKGVGAPAAIRDSMLADKVIMHIPKGSYNGASPSEDKGVVGNVYGVVAHELAHAKNMAKHPSISVRDLPKEKLGVAYKEDTTYPRARRLTDSDIHVGEDEKPLFQDAMDNIARIEEFNRIKNLVRR